MLLLVGDDLADIARFEDIVDRNDLVVYLGADHTVTYLGVDVVSEVDRGRAARKAHNVALRGEHIYVVFREVVADIARNVGGVLRLKLIEDHRL